MFNLLIFRQSPVIKNEYINYAEIAKSFYILHQELKLGH